MAWPSWSLTCLKWSRSSISTLKGRPVRLCRADSSATRSSNRQAELFGNEAEHIDTDAAVGPGDRIALGQRCGIANHPHPQGRQRGDPGALLCGNSDLFPQLDIAGTAAGAGQCVACGQYEGEQTQQRE